ncbi:NAD(+) diphosphatase [Nesterenkonia flava]|uniref:NAD(+) diphosphatase n=1 Tax=Nesterenkonia flava TaxID=469799 RepID=A0ABU1FTL8_9MICC|nr:NAD(+) diphosphatase [Nesterenkonia flava]MDR5711989.1 NAD(+) diphosphatase [Nesterenkonia flava]
MSTPPPTTGRPQAKLELPASQHLLDRRISDREQPGWLQQVWDSPRTLVLTLRNRRAPVPARHSSAASALILQRPSGPLPAGMVYLGAAPESTLYGAGHDQSERVHLVLDASGQGPEDDPEVSWLSLRTALALLDPFHLGLFTQAVAISNWHATATFCGTCGHRTVVRSSGWMRFCSNCSTDHFPRMNPAMITAVVDGQDRLLLGSAYQWEERRFSTFAGFVEAGESLEDTVAREVREEAGVVVRDVQYLGSQPWPFPAQLMLGFLTRVENAEQARPDDDEIRSVRWFTRQGLAHAVSTGEVIIPPRGSISRALIEYWFGGQITGPDYGAGLSASTRARSS